MDELKYKENIEFFKEWDSEFDLAFKQSMALELGYSIDKNGNFVRTNKKLTPKQVPKDLAFEIARAIHFCSGRGVVKKAAKEMLGKRLDNSKWLNVTTKKIVPILKFKIRQHLEIAIKEIERKIEQKMNPSMYVLNVLDPKIITIDNSEAIRALQLEIQELKNENRRISSFRAVDSNTFKTLSRTLGTPNKHSGWSNDLKYRLINAILAPDGAPIIQSRKKERKIRAVNKIVAEMDLKNAAAIKNLDANK